MSIDEKGDDQDLSGREGLAIIRDAAATGDILEFEKVIYQVVARPGFWGAFWQRVQIHLAICNSYNQIIGLANEIINSNSASPEDKAYAKGKRAEAIRGKQQNGCSAGHVA